LAIFFFYIYRGKSIVLFRKKKKSWLRFSWQSASPSKWALPPSTHHRKKIYYLYSTTSPNH
jgi:hypothetical protein